MFFHHAMRVARRGVTAGSMLVAGVAIAEAAGTTPTATVESCTSCHGPDGASLGAIPSIAGSEAGEIAAALRGYRDGSRTGTIMGRLVGPLSDEEIAAIAAYFAAMEEAAK